MDRESAGRSVNSTTNMYTSAPKSTVNHRTTTRNKTLLLVDIHSRDFKKSEGMIYNISSEGIFVLAEDGPQINKFVTLELFAGTSASIRIPGFVVHRRNNGFGMLFLELDVRAQEYVKAQL